MHYLSFLSPAYLLKTMFSNSIFFSTNNFLTWYQRPVCLHPWSKLPTRAVCVAYAGDTRGPLVLEASSTKHWKPAFTVFNPFNFSRRDLFPAASLGLRT